MSHDVVCQIMRIIPRELTGWTILLMHAAEAFILTVCAAFVGGIRFQYAAHNVGEMIILLHCVVTLILLVLSVIMAIKRVRAATTGFVVATAGIVTALYLLPTLAMAR